MHGANSVRVHVKSADRHAILPPELGVRLLIPRVATANPTLWVRWSAGDARVHGSKQWQRREKLDSYRTKRDPKKTPEPMGKATSQGAHRASDS